MVSEEMKQIINEKLKQVEKDRNITILMAVESGSRAWGFPSPDSDYDGRFIFIRPIEEYLKINLEKDTLSLPIKDDLDLVGWDLKKVLSHIKKSSPSIGGWIGSPIVYKDENEFIKELKAISIPYFNALRTLQHFHGLTKKFYSLINENKSVGIKKLFYILRPLLAGWWAIDKNSMPPTEFDKLLSLVDQMSEVKKSILSILEKKKTAMEGHEILIPEEIMEFINSRKKLNEEGIKELSAKQSKNTDFDELNSFFIKVLNSQENNR